MPYRPVSARSESKESPYPSVLVPAEGEHPFPREWKAEVLALSRSLGPTAPPVGSDLVLAELLLPELLPLLKQDGEGSGHWEYFLGQDFDFGRWADFGQALLKFLIILIRLIRSIF